MPLGYVYTGALYIESLSNSFVNTNRQGHIEAKHNVEDTMTVVTP